MSVDLSDAMAYLWRSADLRYKLDDLQLSIRDTINRTSAKKACILSSRQIGKSYWICTHALEYLARNKGMIARIVAPTLKQCNDIVNDNLARIILDAPEGFIERRRSDYRWNVCGNSSLRLGASERANVDSNRGGNASLVVYEELGFVSSADASYCVNSVLGPQLLRSNGIELFVSSPSEDPDHYMHTVILPECEELGTAFRFTVFDSPSITPVQILAAMTRSGCVTTQSFEGELLEGRMNSRNVQELAAMHGSVLSDAFLREYLAMIIRPTTLMVVPPFDPGRHVQKYQLPIRPRWLVSIDWGGVRDKTVAIVHGYEFLTNKDLIDDEQVWEPNTSTTEIVRGLKKWDAEYDITARWADVPGQLQVDLQAEHNYQVQIPQKSDWLASVNSMAVKFAQDQILINPRCDFLCRSLRAGMFNRTRTDFERSEHLGHCDALAALMYAIRMANRENPYAADMQFAPNMYIPDHRRAVEGDIGDLGQALNPKRFGRF